MTKLKLLGLAVFLFALLILMGVVLPTMVSAANTLVSLGGVFLIILLVVFAGYHGYKFVKERIL